MVGWRIEATAIKTDRTGVARRFAGTNPLRWSTQNLALRHPLRRLPERLAGMQSGKAPLRHGARATFQMGVARMDNPAAMIVASSSAKKALAVGTLDSACAAGSLIMTSHYHSTKDLRQRFRCSSRTIFRRMKRAQNPFPMPCIRHSGSFNLWDGNEIAEWEKRERARTQNAA